VIGLTYDATKGIYAMADKRKAPSPPPSSAALVKRARGETPPPMTQIAISAGASDREKALVRNVQRTSGLEAPIVSLAGAHSVSAITYGYFALNPQSF
jgi:Prp8 binding protein